MKTHRLPLLTAVLAAIALAGCGPAEKSSANSNGNPGSRAATTAPATGRAIRITANDTMKYNITTMHAKPGEALSVTLTNVGTTPKFSMGHNWILLQPDTDLLAYVTAASTAAAQDYRPAEFKAQVIAATKLLGPNERDTVTFNAPTQPGTYPFLCSFPGHFEGGMKGVLIVE